jgi:hypothetical protein
MRAGVRVGFGTDLIGPLDQHQAMTVGSRSLKAHLGDGDPAAWRAALWVFEDQFGRPGEPAEQPGLQTIDARQMTLEQRQAAIARMVEEHSGLAALIPARSKVRPRRVTKDARSGGDGASPG